MIDFKNSTCFKLKASSESKIPSDIRDFLRDGENIVMVYKGIRDFVIFTSLRIITVNTQGLTGIKQDFTSIPYKSVRAFSVETAGAIDADSELVIWIAGVGNVKLEFIEDDDEIFKVCKFMSNVVDM